MPLEIDGACPLLQVFDMPASLHFYQNVLGFEIFESTPDWAWLKRDGIDLMLNTAYEAHERPDTPDAARVAAHDDTSIYFGCRDPDAAYEYLTGKGLQIEKPKTAPYGMRQLYIHDPDGYLLCFQCPAET